MLSLAHARHRGLWRCATQEDNDLSFDLDAVQTAQPGVTLMQPPQDATSEALLAHILKSLDDDKAEDIVTIDLKGRSSLTDAIVVATGRSSRHVAALAENLARRMKEWGFTGAHVEGLPQGNWVLIDAGDAIVHLFRAEVRAYYDLEGMWSVDEKKRRRRNSEAIGSFA